MKIRRSFIVVAAMFVQSLLGGSGWAEGFELSDEQLIRLGVELGNPAPMDAMVVATGPAQIVVPPAQQAIASSPAAGLLTRVLVAAGDVVVAGETFAEIESADLLEWQRAFLDAEIEDELAALQLDRDRALVADGIVAERRLQEAQARRRAARASLKQARQRLEISGFSDDAVSQLSASGSLTSRLNLKAPIDGVVVAQYADPGQRVGAMDPIISVANLGKVWVVMHLGAERAGSVEPGMSIVLPVGDSSVAARITVVGQVIESETQTVLVRAEVESPDSRLKAGQFFAAEIVASSEAERGFSLPAKALVRNGEDAFVFVRRPKGFDAVRVVPVHEDDRIVLIDRGVDASTQIAVKGTSTLKTLWLAEAEGEGA
jgi:RND family efflux transporter MFP subunit